VECAKKNRPGLKPMVDVVSFMGLKDLFFVGGDAETGFVHYNLIGQKPVNHFRRPNASFQLVLGHGPLLV